MMDTMTKQFKLSVGGRVERENIIAYREVSYVDEMGCESLILHEFLI